MNNTQKLSVTIITAVVVAGVVAFYSHGSREATLAQFPDVPKDVAKKAYKTIMRNSMRGMYNDLEMTTDQMNTLFLVEVARLQSK
jgi:hypothetical protein